MAVDVEKLIQRAGEAFEKKNFDYAIKLYRDVLAIDPNHAKARNALRLTIAKKVGDSGGGTKFGKLFGGMGDSAKIKMAGGDLKKRMTICEDILVTKPDSIEVHVTLAETLMELGHVAGAAAEAQGTWDSYGQEGRLAKLLGIIYTKLGEGKKAQDYLQRAMTLLPNDRDVNSLLKDALATKTLKEGWEDAKGSRDLIKDKEGAAKAEKDHRLMSDPAQIKAEIERIQGEVDADADNPVQTKNLKKICDLAMKVNDLEAAEAAMIHATRIDKVDSTLRDKLGDIKVKRLELQIAGLAQKIAANAGDAAAKQEKLNADRQLIQVKIEDYTRRVKDRPTDMSVRFMLAKAMFAGSKFDEAIGELQQTIKDPKFKIESHLYLGECFRRKKMYPMAVDQFQKALASPVSSTQEKDLRYRLGEVLELQGNKEKALEEFSKIASLDMSYKDVAKKMEELK